MNHKNAAARAALAGLLAAVGSLAHAQPAGQVQIYGQLNAAVTYRTHQAGGGAGWELGNSPLHASWLGLRGREDLGGGLAALFRLESDVKLDGGSGGLAVAGSNRFWNRQSTVGLNWREQASLTLGRQFHVSSDRVIVALDVFQAGGSSVHITPLGMFGVNRFVGNDTRVDDSIKLRLNGPAGLSAAASVGLNESSGRSHAFDLAQTTPDYTLGAYYLDLHAPAALPATGQVPTHRMWGLGGNLPVGALRLYLNYLRSTLDATAANRRVQENRLLALGVSWQPSAPLLLRAGAYHDRGRALNGVAGRDGEKNTLVLAGEYYLSKRSSLNAALFTNRYSGGYRLDPLNLVALNRDPAAAHAEGLSLGMRHNF
ncbi:MAG TPA: porin [Roseateles sp.]|nr:porin [Roseateles sp.]